VSAWGGLEWKVCPTSAGALGKQAAESQINIDISFSYKPRFLVFAVSQNGLD